MRSVRDFSVSMSTHRAIRWVRSFFYAEVCTLYPELPKLKPPPVDDVVVAAGFDPKRPPLDVLFDVPNVKVIV